jgi:septal ring factor EnvC (AmiA/AmiB activator)
MHAVYRAKHNAPSAALWTAAVMILLGCMAKKFTDEEFRQFVADQIGSVRKELRDMRSKMSGVRREIKTIETTIEPLAEAINIYREDY